MISTLAAVLLVVVSGTTANTGAVALQASALNADAELVSESVLWSFGANDDGNTPIASLIADRSGILYGTTLLGGTNDNGGTAFELRPPSGPHTQWTESVIWSFGAPDDGALPFAGLLADRWRNLYGTTFGGGTNNEGTVFELRPPSGPQNQWTESVLWSFSASGDGIRPEADLVADPWGNIYSTTSGGGTNNNNGTVFELSLR
jgi:uncharacterized repeat protein (TIGR03803 family)